MRRAMWGFALVVAAGVAAGAAAAPASAQMPPSIKGPIDAAKRQANKTSAQINNEQKIGNDEGKRAGGAKASATPAAAAQGTAQKGPAGSRGTKGAPSKSAPINTKAAPDSTPKRGSVSQSGSKGSVTFYREVFAYDAGGRRDPFLSLMATGELRPMISDLTLVGVIYDESGRNSVAILVDASAAGQSYKKKVGDVMGRMKIAKISENSITLNIDEFGFARQETLLIDRSPRTGARRPQ
jgi:Rieske Fe-S protein